VPIATRIQPPQRLTSVERAWMRLTVCSCADPITNDSPTNMPTRTIPATTNAAKAAATPPVETACVARPARIGPVQPKPASRYPNPNNPNASAGRSRLRRAWRASNGLAASSTARNDTGRTLSWIKPKTTSSEPTMARLKHLVLADQAEGAPGRPFLAA
jgi:hypothetical protein